MKAFFEFLDAGTEDGGQWSIEFNDHKGYYQTAQQVIEQFEANEDTGPCLEFQTPELRQKAIDTNTIYYLQWYPHTPNGFVGFAAPTLENLAEWVMKQ